MKTITTIQEYCHEINIPLPKYPFFDIRKFEDNMLTVNTTQAPFRHEFYAIALRHVGNNKEVSGRPLTKSLFFNSPYQLITWDIVPDWEGWYLIFDREFISLNPAWRNFIFDYPFFRLDKYIAFDLPENAYAEVDTYFQKIFSEYHSDNKDKFQFILSYTQLLLIITKRFFDKLNIGEIATGYNRTADIILVSRFQTLIETNLVNNELTHQVRQPSFYAGQLHIHPNHLNAVVKRITDKTATQIIGQYLINLAKSLLRQTGLSVKEIAYRLTFKEPSHFNAFFRNQTGFTPQNYRDDFNL